jgi:hypothetical protein
MADEEKTEKVEIGRNVTFENVMYGKTEPGKFYLVSKRVAAGLRALNATASVASHMAEGKARERAEQEAAAAAGAGGGGEGSPSKTGVIIGGDAGEGGGGSAGGGTGGGSPSSQSSAGGGSGGGGGASVTGVESLTGELPDDFPAKDKLAVGAPEHDPPLPPVTRYEELVKLSKAELDAFPGIGEATIEQIGQRLFADAEKAGGGGQ